jgi:hypothetical protein
VLLAGFAENSFAVLKLSGIDGEEAWRLGRQSG